MLQRALHKTAKPIQILKMETIMTKVIMNYIDKNTPKQDKEFEKKAVSGLLEMHDLGLVSAYEIFRGYNLHRLLYKEQNN